MQDVMFAATQSNGMDMQPIRDNNVTSVFFFIFLILVCGFLTVNMFVGVLCDNYTRIKREKEGDAFLTPKQLGNLTCEKKFLVNISSFIQL